jgi:hypothetical protein
VVLGEHIVPGGHTRAHGVVGAPRIGQAEARPVVAE